MLRMAGGQPGPVEAQGLARWTRSRCRQTRMEFSRVGSLVDIAALHLDAVVDIRILQHALHGVDDARGVTVSHVA